MVVYFVSSGRQGEAAEGDAEGTHAPVFGFALLGVGPNSPKTSQNENQFTTNKTSYPFFFVRSKPLVLPDQDSKTAKRGHWSDLSPGSSGRVLHPVLGLVARPSGGPVLTWVKAG